MKFTDIQVSLKNVVSRVTIAATEHDNWQINRNNASLAYESLIELKNKVDSAISDKEIVDAIFDDINIMVNSISDMMNYPDSSFYTHIASDFEFRVKLVGNMIRIAMDNEL